MKYLVVDEFGNNTDVYEFETEEQAIKYADKHWNATSEADKKKTNAYYVLESVNPDEEADDHMDGNPIKVYK